MTRLRRSPILIVAVLMMAGALVSAGPGVASAAACVSWTGTAPVNPSSSGDSLTGVSVLRPCDVWVVGTQQEGHIEQTLTEHWNGLAWTVIPSANPGGSFNTGFAAVAVKSPADAWAVGTYQGLSAPQTVIELLSGGTWEQVSSPNPGGSSETNVLNDVSIASAKDAWVVGQYGPTTRFLTLIGHWNGVRWTHVPSPNPGALDNDLLGVAATSARDAWAVGYYVTSQHLTRTLIEHWNGKTWKRLPSPDPGGSHATSILQAVAASSASNAWAVGYYFKSGKAQPLLAHWNGSTWKGVTAANLDRPSVDGALTSVTVVSARDAWAVGTIDSPLGTTLAARWNGTNWTRVPTPDPGTYNQLSAVAASSPTNVWAVGYYHTATPAVTWAIHCC